jgi:hypothetical protein
LTSLDGTLLQYESPFLGQLFNSAVAVFIFAAIDGAVEFSIPSHFEARTAF